MLQRLLPILAIALVLAACESQKSAPPANAPATFTGHGKVISVDAARSTITLDHEAIPGFMEAMTMTYHASGPDVLGGVKAGDKVDFTIRYENGLSTLTAVKPAP